MLGISSNLGRNPVDLAQRVLAQVAKGSLGGILFTKRSYEQACERSHPPQLVGANVKSRTTIFGACLVGVLSAPVCADTIPLVPAAVLPVVGWAETSVLAPVESTVGLIADLAGSFGGMLSDDGLVVPDAPVEGSILLTIGLGGAGSDLMPGFGVSDGSGIINLNISDPTGDPAGVSVPLPGAGAMAFAGLAGVLGLSARRRR